MVDLADGASLQLRMPGNVASIEDETGAQGPPGEGVPAGGTTGQVLAKNSNIDYDTEWVTGGGGGGGTVDAVVAGANIDVDSTDPANPIVSVEALTAADIGDFAEVTRDTIGTALVEGSGINITVDDTADTITIAATGGGGGGTVDSIVPGANIDVDSTDPANPIVSVETLTLADVSDVTASAAEVNVLDGVTASTAELNILDGVTATAAELNVVDGITATTAELNFTDGVTSPIQTQLDGKQASDADLTAIAALSPSNDDVIQRKAGSWVARTMAQLKVDLAVVVADISDFVSSVASAITAERTAVATYTNKDLTAGTNTFPTFNQNTTGSAAKWTTARTIAITGDLAYSQSVDGSANVTGAGTLATVNANVGGFGSPSTVTTFTVDAKGRITAASAVDIAVPASAVTSGILDTARLGSGTANSSFFLRGDQQWAGVPPLDPAVLADSLNGNPADSGTNNALYIDASGNWAVAPLPVVNISATGTPSGSTFLRGDGSWASPGGGGLGDVSGPASSVNNNVALFDGTTGKLLKDGGKPLPTGDVIGTTDTQTLTNKTLTAPAISSPTGLVKGDVGLGNVDNTSDANKPVSTATQTALDAKVDEARTINAQTGTTYTFVLTDAGKFVTFSNAAAQTVTVPANSTVAYPTGTVIEGAQLGAGQVTFVGAGGVTVNGTPGLKVAAQYGTYALIKLATDTWLLFGRLSA